MWRRTVGAIAAAGGLLLGACVAGDSGAKALVAGVDTTQFDASVRPQDNLFRYANGGWLANTEIPADRSGYGTFHQLDDEAQTNVRAIIEEASARPDATAGSEARKVGDLFASFMNEARVDSLGITPIADELAAVDAVKDPAEFVELVAKLQAQGVDGLLSWYVTSDAKKSDENIIYLFQDGLGLPDRDYYLTAQFAEMRPKYVSHIEKMLTLAQRPEPRRSAEAIMALETRLARAHWTRVESRDDDKTYNKRDLAQLARTAPGIDWPRFFAAAGAPTPPSVIVSQPSFFTAMARSVGEVPLETWKAWLAWKVISSHARLLSKPFVDENFAFFGTALRGTPENRPRWKRGVTIVEGAMGEAVGKLYVDKHFPPAAKVRMDTLVANLVEAYRQGITSLVWMGEETKQKAHAKIAKFRPKIGYPDKWRDYSALEIDPNDLVGNVQRATAFENARQFAKLGKPVDRDEWLMTPQTVNAYYNPVWNEIVFPAAILQPPFFNMAADDAVNYGGIGGVIGHEIGHAFDDQGSKYDGDGNMNNWWTEQDRKEFERRAKMLIEQYSAFEVLPKLTVNGALTVGENIGDLGGLTIAHRAYLLSLKGADAPVIDGLTGEQRFFLGWAQVWREKRREQSQRELVATDPHAPGEFRANVVRNMPEFYAAFGVKEGDGLFLPPEKRVKIW